jgi:hypothetical protein
MKKFMVQIYLEDQLIWQENWNLSLSFAAAQPSNSPSNSLWTVR